MTQGLARRIGTGAHREVVEDRDVDGAAAETLLHSVAVGERDGDHVSGMLFAKQKKSATRAPVDR